MALTDKQIQELNIASQRVAGGTGTAIDKSNIDYATKKFGYSYKPIEADIIGTNKIDLPYNINNFDNSSSVVAGANTGLKGLLDYYDKINKPTELQQTRDTLVSKLTNLLPEASGKETALATKQEELGVPKLQQDLAKIYSDIQTKTAEYNKLTTDIEGKPIPMSFITGQQAQVKNQAAAEIGLLQAQSLGLTGQLEAAQNTASRAIDLAYSAKENEIKLIQAQLEALKPSLDAEEKRQSDIRSVMLQQYLSNINTEKENQKELFKLSVTPTKISERIVTDEYGNKTSVPVYALYDLNTKEWKEVGTNNYITGTDTTQQYSDVSGKANIGGYDITSYATDPLHEQKIENILKNIGKFKTLQDVTNYIKSKYPNSPITAQMISNASSKYGVSWEMLVAMMEQDSSLGTAGVGARTYNPGNVGNIDSGATRNYGNWQSGVDAIGDWLNKHRTTQEITGEEDLSGKYSQTIINAAESVYNRQRSLDKLDKKLQPLVQNYLDEKYNGELKPYAIAGVNGDEQIFIPKTSLTQTESQKVQQVMSGLNLINKAKELYSKAVGYDIGGISLIAKPAAWARGISRSTGLNQDWNVYQKFLESNLASIAKGLKGEVGNLSEYEQKNALKTFPSKWSTPLEAEQAFQNAYDLALGNLKTIGEFSADKIINTNDGKKWRERQDGTMELLN